MPRLTCPARNAFHLQHDAPCWPPLIAAVGERLASGFMWMHEDELEDGTTFHSYKHLHTRSYLHLSEDGRAFEWTPCDRYVELRLDFAIERALCSWWVLEGWEPADAEAIRDAILRAQNRDERVP
jgi:hypothetical protein